MIGQVIHVGVRMKGRLSVVLDIMRVTTMRIVARLGRWSVHVAQSQVGLVNRVVYRRQPLAMLVR
ncbi:TPA: hypothetical protein DCZ81_00645 [Candidatus Collierbacteria bacterium]|nr:hypothetical protein [Candidatus Collierbacteria bacterium]